ncbi:ribonuclease M5 [Bacillus shivajii]|uniref:ribonuclease M5 n=1 Tax=Bacillus shivajii TaxID=1983719 RepID=UPI001CFA4952|nr:ribonuclease M5 [Bacillus shivajii]UCZ53301.1 ribonuclease M5 [Bacillus shivajii]
MKPYIKEMIVVEGKSDTNALQKTIDCDTIETNGSAVSNSVIQQVKLAKERRGVIVFTDPDFPGEKIRKTIDQAVPGCKHAFLPKEAAIDVRKKKVGVEHASNEDLYNALKEAKPSYTTEETTLITQSDLITAGLLAGKGSKQKRERLGVLLKIGYSNGKQLLKRLQQFRVTKKEFITALQQIEREQQHDE